MTDERYYCVQHRRPVEYIPELELYSCGLCECTYSRDELIPASLLETSMDVLMAEAEKQCRARQELSK